MPKRLHLVVVTATVVLLGFAGLARAAATSPRSPVDLATPDRLRLRSRELAARR